METPSRALSFAADGALAVGLLHLQRAGHAVPALGHQAAQRRLGLGLGLLQPAVGPVQHPLARLRGRVQPDRDLAGFIDVPAEIARNEKQEEKLLGLIKGKEGKLNNAGFVDRAPADVVAKERAGLVEFQEQLAAVRAALVELRGVTN